MPELILARYALLRSIIGPNGRIMTIHRAKYTNWRDEGAQENIANYQAKACIPLGKSSMYILQTLGGDEGDLRGYEVVGGTHGEPAGGSMNGEDENGRANRGETDETKAIGGWKGKGIPSGHLGSEEGEGADGDVCHLNEHYASINNANNVDEDIADALRASKSRGVLPP